MKRFLCATLLASALLACSGDPTPAPGCPAPSADDSGVAADTGTSSGPVIHRAKGIPAPHIPPLTDDAGCCGEDTGTSSPDDLTYHGGPVMANGVTVHVVWYGDWSGNTATEIVPEFLSHLGGTPYMQINSAYSGRVAVGNVPYDPDGGTDAEAGLSTDRYYVANAVKLGLQVTDAYSRGKDLSEADVYTVVAAQLVAGTLPKDSNALYAVLISSDVKQHIGLAGFCEWFCGWHSPQHLQGIDAHVILAGDVSTCTAGCAPDNPTVSPNGNVGADGMLSVIAHEIDESVTDPDLDAWFYDWGGFSHDENGDRCAWTFGDDVYTLPSGAKANVRIEGKDYYIQQNWVPPTPYAVAKCAMRP